MTQHRTDVPGRRRRAHRVAGVTLVTALVAALLLPTAAAARPSVPDAAGLLDRVSPRAQVLDLDGQPSSALYVTESGWVVGVRAPYETQRVFRWREGVLEVLQPHRTDPLSVNERGQVLVGGRDLGGPSYVARWDPDGSLVRLSAPGTPARGNGMNEDGTVAGHVGESPHRTAVVWRDGRQIDLPGVAGMPGEYLATDVASDGDVVGLRVADGTVRAVLWRDGRAQQLPTPDDARESIPYGITRYGSVAGVIRYADGRPDQDVLWVDGGEPRERRRPCQQPRELELPGAGVEAWPLELSRLVVDGCAPLGDRLAGYDDWSVRGGNGRGMYVGLAVRRSTGEGTAVMSVHGVPVPLRPPPGREDDALLVMDVNGGGLAVGSAATPTRFGPGPHQAVIWRLLPTTTR